MSTDDLPSNIVPLESGLSLRFYEAVLFLYCLKEVKYKAESVKEPEPDLESDTGKSSRNSFRCFVDKLGQICNSELRGKTVTAFAVLQPGQIQYRFASNQRTNDELEDVKRYLVNLLGLLGTTPDNQLNGVFGTVLERVVAFNRPVIEQYIKNLTQKERLDFCAEGCEQEETAEGYTALEAARDIDSLRRFCLPREKPSLESFVTQTRELLAIINQLYNSPFEAFIHDKARADRDPTTKTPWSELRHAFGRLHSYTIAVKVLISMRRRRRELFEDFEIVAVPSSVRSGCPHVRRIVDGKKGILQRMEKLKMAEAYNANLPQEQQKAMQDQVKAIGTAGNGRFRPYVHAELVLLDSILTEEQRECVTLRFFAESNYGRYIGCSKPTCRLCKLYIDNHPSGVEFRPEHGNIYYEWRAPDICTEDGVNVAQVQKTREDIHWKMLETLRQMIKRTITENKAERKHHDSNTSPTSYMGGGSSTYNPHWAAQASPDSMDSISTTGAMDDSDDVANKLRRLSIAGGGGRSSSSTSASRSSQETTPVPERNVGSPFASSVDLKPSINRRQRPLIIEDEE